MYCLTTHTSGFGTQYFVQGTNLKLIIDDFLYKIQIRKCCIPKYNIEAWSIIIFLWWNYQMQHSGYDKDNIKKQSKQRIINLPNHFEETNPKKFLIKSVFKSVLHSYFLSTQYSPCILPNKHSQALENSSFNNFIFLASKLLFHK